jgi:hypothetical protein
MPGVRDGDHENEPMSTPPLGPRDYSAVIESINGKAVELAPVTITSSRTAAGAARAAAATLPAVRVGDRLVVAVSNFTGLVGRWAVTIDAKATRL